MLYAEYITYNVFEENTYIIRNEQKDCWIVDPGMYDEEETQHFFNYLVKETLTVKGIINTHAHIDHIFGIKAVLNRFAVPFYLHKDDECLLEYAPTVARNYGFTMEAVPPNTHNLEEGKLTLGKDTLELLHLPGHSAGSIGFYYPPGNWIIGGDVLFAGSIGRTDLPGGSFEQLSQSIRQKMYLLPDNTQVLPGHGTPTTIGQERIHNAFVKL